MNQFKPGDRVRCIQEVTDTPIHEPEGILFLNNIYTVEKCYPKDNGIELDPPAISLVETKGAYCFIESRFRLENQFLEFVKAANDLPNNFNL